MARTKKSSETSNTWLRSDGDQSSYRGYQASYSSAKTLELPKGGSAVSKMPEKPSEK